MGLPPDLQLTFSKEFVAFVDNQRDGNWDAVRRQLSGATPYGYLARDAQGVEQQLDAAKKLQPVTFEPEHVSLVHGNLNDPSEDVSWSLEGCLTYGAATSPVKARAQIFVFFDEGNWRFSSFSRLVDGRSGQQVQCGE